MKKGILAVVLALALVCLFIMILYVHGKKSGSIAGSQHNSTLSTTMPIVTMNGTDGPPTANSIQAVTLTAQANSLCTAIEPFYWEIGNKNSSLASGSVGTYSNGKQVLGTTNMAIASASKWIYATYVVQLRGSAANLTANDIKFLNFISGYTNMPGGGSGCPTSINPDTVNGCLALTNPNTGQPYTAQNQSTVGVFYYDSGHMENHASQFTQLGNVSDYQLGKDIGSEIGVNSTSYFVYSVPLLSGGVVTNAEVYAGILRGILSGRLAMHNALNIQPVCTLPSSTCPAMNSPIPVAWNYSMGHWIETPAGDGAFSSPGAFGFYPWIDSSETYYGIIARVAKNNVGEGYKSAECGQALRRAWTTGVQQ